MVKIIRIIRIRKETWRGGARFGTGTRKLEVLLVCIELCFFYIVVGIYQCTCTVGIVLSRQ